MAYWWQVEKQVEPSANTTGSETHNEDTIKSVLANIIIPNAQHLDVLVTLIHFHHDCGTIEMRHTKSDLMLANPNTKATGGPTLQKKTDCVINACFYPPTDSDHSYILLVNKENFVHSTPT
eukprot:1955507-Ditylum_brightwellii.AAC.1